MTSLADPSPASARDPVAMLLGLTFVTGIIDAVSFLGLGHIFTANMTGNTIFLGFALAGAPGLSISRSSAALAAFLAGAVLGGRLMRKVGSRSAHRRLAVASAAEGALLLASLAPCALIAPGQSGRAAPLFGVIVLSALAMGIRNAAVRSLAVADLTTTVLTLILTGLAADSTPAGGGNPRWPRRVASPVMMLAGAAVGAALLQHSLLLTMSVCTLCVLLCAAAAQVMGRESSAIRARIR